MLLAILICILQSLRIVINVIIIIIIAIAISCLLYGMFVCMLVVLVQGCARMLTLFWHRVKGSRACLSGLCAFVAFSL